MAKTRGYARLAAEALEASRIQVKDPALRNQKLHEWNQFARANIRRE